MKVLVLGAGGPGRTRVVPSFLARRYEAGRHRPRSAWTSRSREAVFATIADMRPDIVVNAAAYTAVDRAESEPDAAWAANCAGPGNIAAACREIRHSADPYLDRLCLRRHQERRLPRGRSGQSAGGLRREQGGRRARGARGAARAHHSAHRLGLQRARAQFRQDDAAPRRRTPGAAGRRRPDRLADQRGGHRRRDRADRAARHERQCGLGNLPFRRRRRRDLARLRRGDFRSGVRWRGPPPRVEAITTADYPTPARRPGNSVLDCSRIGAAFGIELRPWRAALAEVIEELGRHA